jgi:hypothetical protein
MAKFYGGWHAVCAELDMRPLPCLLLLWSLLKPALALASPPGPDPTLQCRAAIARAEQEAQIPAGLLQAIGRVESGRRNPETGTSGPWPWTINAEGRGHFFPDRAAAIAAVRELQGRGVRLIDVGCMQVNLHHHPRAFASLEEAFDPVANARYAAQFLTQLHAARNDWITAAGHYHSHTPELAQAYRARVQAAWPATQARAAEDRALVGMSFAAQRALAPPTSLSLSNREERAQILPGTGSTGRGLDAYRANPIPVTGRPIALVPSSLVRR